MPCFRANSRICFTSVADLMSLLGVKWSGISAMRSGSNTLSNPAFSNSSMATGAVMSLPRQKSTRAMMRSPGATDSSPAARARSFSVIVIAIDVYLWSGCSFGSTEV